MRLYLIRHGQTSWNLEGKAQGHTDIELDSIGLSQADRLGDAFEDVPLATIYTSDLRRAKQTAEAVARASRAQLVELTALRERSFGRLEGSDYLALNQNLRNEAECARVPVAEVRPSGGESLYDVWERLGPVARLLEEAAAPTAVVCHGGSGTLLLARLLHASVDTARAFRLRNATITELSRLPEGLWRIERLDDASHLEVRATDATLTA